MSLSPLFFFPVKVLEKKELGHMKTQYGKLGQFGKLLDYFVNTATLKVVGCHIMSWNMFHFFFVFFFFFLLLWDKELVIIGLNIIRTGEREEMIERREEQGILTRSLNLSGLFPFCLTFVPVS